MKRQLSLQASFNKTFTIPKKKKQDNFKISSEKINSIVSKIISNQDWVQDPLPFSSSELKDDENIKIARNILEDLQEQANGAVHCCKSCPSYLKWKEENQDEEDNPRLFGVRDDFSEHCSCPCKCCIENRGWRLKKPVKLVNYRDGMIGVELKQELKEELKKLENSVVTGKHNISNDENTDLFQSEMFCVITGLSEGSTKEEMSEYDDNCISGHWLPSQFSIKLENHQYKVNIDSYLNNIDWRHQSRLYSIIEEIFRVALPQIQMLCHNNEDVLFKKGQQETILNVVVRTENIEIPADKYYVENGTYYNEGDFGLDFKYTLIYCYEMENVEDNSCHYDMREKVENFNAHKYNIAPGQILCNQLGSFEIKEDRLIVFLNHENQLRKRHFFVSNPYEKATVKRLIFHIQDPKIETITTKQVEIQREDHMLSKCFVLVKILPFHIVQNQIVPYFKFIPFENAINFATQIKEMQQDIIDENIECHDCDW